MGKVWGVGGGCIDTLDVGGAGVLYGVAFRKEIEAVLYSSISDGDSVYLYDSNISDKPTAP